MTFDDLQSQVAVWHHEHFPDADATDVLLKAVSEMGELADAQLSCRLLPESPLSQCHVDRMDAIGDVIICLAALCYKIGLPLEGIIKQTWAEVQAREHARVRR
jgi:NTP pyrophosphatase (non-canonical NTP hydrolase)